MPLRRRIGCKPGGNGALCCGGECKRHDLPRERITMGRHARSEPMLRPRFITFDCYGTLTRFRMAEMTREIFADRVPADRIDAFVRDLPGLPAGRGAGGLEALCGRDQERGRAHLPQAWGRIRRGGRAALSTTRSRAGRRITTCRPALLKVAKQLSAGQPVERGQRADRAPTSRSISAPFHAVFTAEQAQSYKPRMQGFEYMLEISRRAAGGAAARLVVSLRYDLMTAHDLGITRQGLGQPRTRAGEPVLWLS